MDEQRPPPEITVRDPARPGRPVDVLVHGDDVEPRPSPFTRRRVLIGLVVLALLAGVAGVLEVRERRAAQAQERREAGAVELTVLEQPNQSSTFTGTGLRLDVVVRLHNDGPRPVRLLRGGAAGYGLVAELELRPGRVRSVLLQRVVTCGSTPSAPAASELLALTVRTQAGLRQVELPLPFPLGGRDDLQLCGDVPLERSVSAGLLAAEPLPREVRLTVELVSGATRRVDVVGLSAGDGVRVQVREPAAGLPLSLPPAGAGSTVLEVALGVQSCALALASPAEADLVGSQPLVVLLADDGGRRAQVEALLDVDLVRGLVERSCRGRR